MVFEGIDPILLAATILMVGGLDIGVAVLARKSGKNEEVEGEEEPHLSRLLAC